MLARLFGGPLIDARLFVKAHLSGARVKIPLVCDSVAPQRWLTPTLSRPLQALAMHSNDAGKREEGDKHEQGADSDVHIAVYEVKGVSPSAHAPFASPSARLRSRSSPRSSASTRSSPT